MSDNKIMDSSKYLEGNYSSNQFEAFFQKQEDSQQAFELNTLEAIWNAWYNLFLLVKNGDIYERLDEECYEKYRELNSESFSEGFYGKLTLNEEGDLAAGVKKYKELVVKRIDNDMAIWSFSLDEVKKCS